jgi:hypothetical protein
MTVVINGTSGIFSPDYEVNGVTGQIYPLVSGTAVTASGTSVTFAVPAWVKRITVMVQGLSFADSTGQSRVQIGTGAALTTTGYTGDSIVVTGSNTCNTSSFTNGLALFNVSDAGDTLWGVATITKITGNTWISSFISCRSDGGASRTGTSYIALAGALDIVGIAATVSTFDAGTINVLYE